eukprot:scaffold34_cov62-Phaeocystis_antarctica.AAC.13
MRSASASASESLVDSDKSNMRTAPARTAPALRAGTSWRARAEDCATRHASMSARLRSILCRSRRSENSRPDLEGCALRGRPHECLFKKLP